MRLRVPTMSFNSRIDEPGCLKRLVVVFDLSLAAARLQRPRSDLRRASSWLAGPPLHSVNSLAFGWLGDRKPVTIPVRKRWKRRRDHRN